MEPSRCPLSPFTAVVFVFNLITFHLFILCVCGVSMCTPVEAFGCLVSHNMSSGEQTQVIRLGKAWIEQQLGTNTLTHTHSHKSERMLAYNAQILGLICLHIIL